MNNNGYALSGSNRFLERSNAGVTYVVQAENVLLREDGLTWFLETFIMGATYIVQKNNYK